MQHPLNMFNKKNKIITINAKGGNFFSVFQKQAQEHNIKHTTLESLHCCIILNKDKGVIISENNTPIDFSHAYVYIKHKKKDSYFIYILCEYFYKNKITFNDPTINRSSQYAGNKTSQLVKMFLDKVPVPNSIICTQKSYHHNKETILKEISFPCVAKRSGSKGRKVWKIENITELENVINMKPAEDVTLIQEFIPNSFDTRVFIFEDSILASVTRTSSDGFYNNLSQGGVGKKATLTRYEKKMCIKAMKSTGLTVGGADMVKDSKGNIYFFEINKNPEIEIFETYAQVPIREKIFEEIIYRYF